KYVPGPNTVAVTETLAGTDHNRQQSYQDGVLTGETFVFGAAKSIGTRTFNYEKSRLVSSLDERGFTRNYSYDSHGRLASVQVVAKADLGAVTELTQTYNAEGKVTKSTGADGLDTNIDYDVLGRPASWDYGAEDVESVTLDARGAVVSRTFGSLP